MALERLYRVQRAFQTAHVDHAVFDVGQEQLADFRTSETVVICKAKHCQFPNAAFSRALQDF